MNHGEDRVKRYEVYSNNLAYENIVELHETEASSTASTSEIKFNKVLKHISRMFD